MHIELSRLRWLAGVLFFAITTHAGADAGVNVSGTGSHEEYRFASGDGTVDWQRITVYPWWANDDWRVEAEIPWLTRDVNAQGAFYVQRFILGKWRTIPVSADYTQHESGFGDSYLRATRSWHPDNILRPYVTTEVKLPTGDPDRNAGTLATSVGSYSGARSARGTFSFGNDSTDFRLAPGIAGSNEYLWATLEGGYIWSSPGEVEVIDRPMAYFGFGLTPKPWLELAAEFDYEGETVDNGDPLEQWTYTLTLRPTPVLSVTLSTYDTNQKPEPDSNWSLGMGLNF